jgi:hypothetical protein
MKNYSDAEKMASMAAEKTHMENIWLIKKNELEALESQNLLDYYDKEIKWQEVENRIKWFSNSEIEELRVDPNLVELWYLKDDANQPIQKKGKYGLKYKVSYDKWYHKHCYIEAHSLKVKKNNLNSLLFLRQYFKKV